MGKIILNCSLGNETCTLTFSIKQRSVLDAYDVYKNGQWICLIQRQNNASYQIISYLRPMLQSDIDAIGKQLELRNNNIDVHTTKKRQPQPIYR